MKRKTSLKIADVAMSRKKADLVIKNANIVNVFTNEIIISDIAIADGIIAGIGNYSGMEEIDAEGAYVCPGFIDSHLHIESSFVAPAEFMRSVIPHGTLTVIADPHEIANVCGLEGIEFFINQTENIPANVLFSAPSCVPAVDFEKNGAILKSKDLKKLLKYKRIVALGEVMDFPAVISGKGDVYNKLSYYLC